ncbi:helix-turn-helix domain-containing protein [Gordonia humi]|uniref:helix-turn-helix domain-containing protein n=1 Tax=Gordonia humi TaxID=686429 RepID=UPI0036152079
MSYLYVVHHETYTERLSSARSRPLLPRPSTSVRIEAVGNEASRGRPRDPDVSSRIVDAALVVYARRGWSAFTMDGVAREAGVGKAALYRRWSDKKGLLLDALELRSERVSARAAVLLAGDVRADLVALAAALMRHFLDPGAGRRSGPLSTWRRMNRQWRSSMTAWSRVTARMRPRCFSITSTRATCRDR